jgi:cytochrome b561
VCASDERYTPVAIALHWVVVALVGVQIAWGWGMQAIPKQPPGLRADAFNVHKSVGVAILVVMVVRLAWRLAHRPPPLPSIPAWQRIAAHANHAVLYVALLAMPVIGLVGSFASGYPVRVFGVTLPSTGWRDEAVKTAMSAAHLATSWVLTGAIVLHVGAAFKHALVDRDAVLARMLPGRRSRPPAGGLASD